MPLLRKVGDTLADISTAAHAIIGHLMSGLPLVPEEDREKRMVICRGCPSGCFDNNWCNKDKGGCGCFLPAKTSLPNESCPLGFWTQHALASGLPVVTANTNNNAEEGCKPCEEMARMSRIQAENATNAAKMDGN